MKNKKMIVVDLDGTLLNIKGYCSYKTKKYLKRLKELGCTIVIATGRTLKSAMDSTDGAEFANYIIASNGAVLYDRDNFRLLMNNTIKKETIKRICSDYNDDIKYFEIADLFYYHRYKYNKNFDLTTSREIKDIDKFVNNCEDAVNMLIKFKDNSLVRKYYDKWKSNDLSILIMQDSFSEEKCLEISANGISKYNAIKFVMDRENISNDEIISFGDGLNDVDMIKMCGIGVAMGNALDEVKSVSNYITISHNEDGVIYFLKRYLEENNLSN